jgi:hypothetical protein
MCSVEATSWIEPRMHARNINILVHCDLHFAGFAVIPLERQPQGPCACGTGPQSSTLRPQPHPPQAPHVILYVRLGRKFINCSLRNSFRRELKGEEEEPVSCRTARHHSSSINEHSHHRHWRDQHSQGQQQARRSKPRRELTSRSGPRSPKSW